MDCSSYIHVTSIPLRYLIVLQWALLLKYKHQCGGPEGRDSPNVLRDHPNVLRDNPDVLCHNATNKIKNDKRLHPFAY